MSKTLMEPNDEFSLQKQLEIIKKDLQRAKSLSNVGFVFSGIAILFAGVMAFTKMQQPPSMPKPISQPAPSAVYPSYPSSASFQTIDAQRIRITDQSGNVVGVLYSGGLTFSGTDQMIAFGNGSKLSAVLADQGLYIGSTNGSETDTTAGKISITSPKNSGLGSTTVVPWFAQFESADNYSEIVGSLGTTNGFMGLTIYNGTSTGVSKTQVNKSGMTLSLDNLSFYDDAGIDRISVGKTSLVIPANGATSTTALSSITLFDASNHISWQTPW